MSDLPDKIQSLGGLREARKKLSALERARAELQAGRPDKARDRVTGWLSSLHLCGEYSQEAYALLGEIYFAMKDFSLAGAAWFLTERDDADSRMAGDAFHERFGRDPLNVLRATVPRAPLEAYPPKVRERLSACGYRHVPRRSRRAPGGAIEGEGGVRSGVRPIEAGCLLFAVMSVIFIAYYFYLTFRGRG